MNKFFFFFLLNFLFSDSTDCLNKFYNYNKDYFNSGLLFLKVSINNNKDDSVSIFINKKKRYKIEFNDKIIYADNDKIINYSPKTSQLYIDKPDTILNNLIFSVSDSLSFENFFKNNHLNYSNMKIYYSKECHIIDSVLINISNQFVKFNNVKIDTFKIESSDSIFKLNIDENKVFKYDFR